ncbi:MAG: UDP-N-acetylmuramate dehydrogenase [Candidatus Hydrogenedentes bacterium]|nr:UDP-N-acetylmuramate dehydrogenase [Candidatus Hydrogenedentota bacterium]
MERLPFEFAAENYPLAPATLYYVGGPARLALLPRTVEETLAAYQWMLDQPGPRLVLGGGSNILISNRGFPGIVLFTTGLNRIESLDDDRYHVEAGVVLDRLVCEVMIAHNYDGVGGLTGIPGSVGGAIYMNAGTVNGTTCQWIEHVEVATKDGLVTIHMEPTLYGYRGQRFCPPGGLILRGLFHFRPTQEPQRPIYDHYIQRRKKKQPQGHCCGSVFKNPPNDHAGRLIEACGLKGTRRGGAIVSPMHANFIMNEDHATFDDILWLIELCKRRVKEEHGVELEEEVVIIGEKA